MEDRTELALTAIVFAIALFIIFCMTIYSSILTEKAKQGNIPSKPHTLMPTLIGGIGLLTVLVSLVFELMSELEIRPALPLLNPALFFTGLIVTLTSLTSFSNAKAALRWALENLQLLEKEGVSPAMEFIKAVDSSNAGNAFSALMKLIVCVIMGCILFGLLGLLIINTMRIYFGHENLNNALFFMFAVYGAVFGILFRNFSWQSILSLSVVSTTLMFIVGKLAFSSL